MPNSCKSFYTNLQSLHNPHNYATNLMYGIQMKLKFKLADEE
jgi:hypothetical protein